MSEHVDKSVGTGRVTPGGGNVSQLPPRNFAELLLAVESAPDLSVAQRRRLSTAIHTAARIASTAMMRRDTPSAAAAKRDVVLSRIPCDIGWLNRYLFAYHPMSSGRISPETFQNVTSSLRSALDLVGLLPPNLDALPPDAADWHAALAALRAKGSQFDLALTRFAPWCHSQGIGPSEVTTETLARFRDYASTHLLGGNIARHVRSIAKAMRRVGEVAGPHMATLRSPRRHEPYVLPLESYPASLRADFAAFMDRYAGKTSKGPFRGDGPPRSLSPETVAARAFSLKQALAGLVHSGRDIATITSLANLVEVEAFKTILHHYWTRAIALKVARGVYASTDETPNEAGITEQTGAIAGVVMIVARHYLKRPDHVIKELATLAADLTPRQNTSIRKKNLDRLRQFDTPKTRSDLLHLPQTLMRRARNQELDLKPPARARLARTALTVEILLNSPIRLKNLCQLRHGVHLRTDGSRHGTFTRLLLEPHETKNKVRYEALIAPGLADLLDEYLKIHHPVLAPKGSHFLFPSGDGSARSISDGTLRTHLQRAIEAEIGATMTPHLFRHFLARITLEEDPNALEDVRQLLGDKSMVTVLANYAAVEPAQASRRHHGRLHRARTGETHAMQRSAKSKTHPRPTDSRLHRRTP